MCPVRIKFIKFLFYKCCRRKVPFLTRDMAQESFDKLQKLNGGVFDFGLRIYKCSWGNHYHVGHKVRKTEFFQSNLPPIMIEDRERRKAPDEARSALGYQLTRPARA